MQQRKKNVSEIPAEKMALIAENGLDAARLSRSEMLYLTKGGLKELYNIKKNINGRSPSLDRELIGKIMTSYFPEAGAGGSCSLLTDIIVQSTKNAMKVIVKNLDWQLDSPAFARRGSESGAVSIYRDAGKYTVHIEITKSSDYRAIINVRLTDKSKLEHSSFEATLFQKDRCIESVHVSKNPVASFSNVEPGDYLLKVSDKKGLTASIAVRLEK